MAQQASIARSNWDICPNPWKIMPCTDAAAVEQIKAIDNAPTLENTQGWWEMAQKKECEHYIGA